jgi:hypothetical protein
VEIRLDRYEGNGHHRHVDPVEEQNAESTINAPHRRAPDDLEPVAVGVMLPGAVTSGAPARSTPPARVEVGEGAAGNLLQASAADETAEVDGGEAGGLEEFGDSGLGLVVVATERQHAAAVTLVRIGGKHRGGQRVGGRHEPGPWNEIGDEDRPSRPGQALITATADVSAHPPTDAGVSSWSSGAGARAPHGRFSCAWLEQER